jgi:hypothetical protein
MASPDGAPTGAADPLRAEHDALAARLAVRRSVDELRTAAYEGFATILAIALAAKFAWDRWGWSRLPRPPLRGRYPLLFLAAALLAVVLGTLTVCALRRARAHRDEEERLYARFRELRAALRLDP